MLLASIGCARYASEPEFSPRSWAPQAVEREWTPPAGSQALAAPVGDYAIRSDRLPKDQNLTLAELIGFALANNPSTRSSWRSAQRGRRRGRYRARPVLSDRQRGKRRMAISARSIWFRTIGVRSRLGRAGISYPSTMI